MKNMVNRLGLKGILLCFFMVIIGGKIDDLPMAADMILMIFGSVLGVIYLEIYLQDYRQNILSDLKTDNQKISEQLTDINNNQKIYMYNFEKYVQGDILKFDDLSKKLQFINEQVYLNVATLNTLGENIESDLTDINNSINENSKNIEIAHENMRIIAGLLNLDFKTRIIEDKDNKTMIFNTFKNNVMVYSEMRDDNKLSFMAFYDAGKIISSRSFDENGNITAENFYYKSGELKKRKIYTIINGKTQIETENFEEMPHK